MRGDLQVPGVWGDRAIAGYLGDAGPRGRVFQLPCSIPEWSGISVRVADARELGSKSFVLWGPQEKDRENREGSLSLKQWS